MDQSKWRGELRQAEKLDKYTSWRVGGPAEFFYIPKDVEDLAVFVKDVADKPLFFLGLGSNLLVRDGGIPGYVVWTLAGLNQLQQQDGGRWRVEAGVTCAKLARETARAGYTDAEFLAGIPGSFGGALAMNAGAFGGETWPLVVEVETLDRAGVLRKRSPQEYQIAYREVKGPSGEFFVAATLELTAAVDDSGSQRIRGLLEKRKQSQPIGLPSCGSVFRNPPGDFAARLIEAAGLKGTQFGGACVSPKHANFIINTGTASAEEIESLILHVQAEVNKQFSINLHPEVHIVGIFA